MSSINSLSINSELGQILLSQLTCTVTPSQTDIDTDTDSDKYIDPVTKENEEHDSHSCLVAKVKLGKLWYVPQWSTAGDNIMIRVGDHNHMAYQANFVTRDYYAIGTVGWFFLY